LRIAIFGAGAVGGYYGTRLAQAGHSVSLVARGAHLEAIRESGLRLESVVGDAILHPTHVTDRPEEIGEVEWVICGVKSWQLSAAARAMAPLVGESGSVLPLQNGVEAADVIGAELGAERVVGGTTWILSEVAAPGLIRHSGAEPRIVLGELAGGSSPRVEALAEALRGAGVRAEVAPRVSVDIWSKFLFIASVSGVGAVARQPLGAWRGVPQTRALLRAAIEEAAAVARARGVPLPGEIVDETLAFVDRLPPHSTASMQRDIQEGRPSELDAQSGALVRLARESGVEVPAHAFIEAALRPSEDRARALRPSEDPARR
jgi:2-dehydropantoate 2-reductase